MTTVTDILIYNLTPSFCPKCNSPKEYIKRNNTFCSQICANSHVRTKESLQKLSFIMRNSEKNRIAQANRKRTSLKPRKSVECKICQIEYEVICTKNEPYYCSSEKCRKQAQVNFGRANAAKRNKRSKLEIQLANLCERHFNIETNKPIANGWDADILLMDHKVAILWNGPWHYKEMNMTNHSLCQVVNRDVIKIIEFEKIGWEVLIYQDNEWTPETALIDILLRTKNTILVPAA